MTNIRDQAGEYAVVWALPFAVWGAVMINGVDDIMGNAPWTLLLRVAWAIALSVAASLVMHYLTILKEVEAGLVSPRFHALHASVVSGGRAAAWYAHTLTRLLDAVDRFFGDAQRTCPAWQQRLFKLRTPAPLWSAPAFDRCLHLGLVYPVLIVWLLWIISGHVGPVEKALGLPMADFSQRGGVALGCISLAWTSRKIRQSAGLMSLFYWLINLASFYVILLIGLSTDTGRDALVFGMVFGVTVIGPFLVGNIDAPTCSSENTDDSAGALCVAFIIAFDFAIARVGVFIGFFVYTSLTVLIFAFIYAARHKLELYFFMLFWPIFTLLSLALPIWWAALPNWSQSGPILLFLGLLTLLNVPFDWLSLGLTRGLLRRGLELHGPWPWALALLDAVLAALCIALLALVMVLGVQWFDDLAVHAGGQAVLNLPVFLAGLEARPGEPEYWWAYALLLSTLIPSMVNLAVASTSWLRSWPWLSRWVLRQLPSPAAPHAMADNSRYVTALVLTAQWVLGTALALLWQGLLVWLLLVVLMPALGVNLLHVLQAVVQHDWPGQWIARW